MLPYFATVDYTVGPLTIHVWGFFIALGIVCMLGALRAECAARKLTFETFFDLTLWVVIAAFIGARFAHVFFYEPAFFLKHPVEILKVWNGGLASTGGIIFGTLAALFFVWRKKLPFIQSGDALFRAMPIAWCIGRFGCYLTHMHPGELSHSFLAVNYPDGLRHDLGLYEFFFWALLTIIFWLPPRARRAGIYFSLVPLLYAPIRFTLDFFRIEQSNVYHMADARYGSLTPAQYTMIFIFFLGLLVAKKSNLFTFQKS